MNYTFIKYSFLAFFILACIGCATTEPEVRPRIPNYKTTAPQYESDEKLQKEIEVLKKELETEPQNTDKLVRLAGLYIELKDNANAISTLEKLKSLNYTANPKVYASLGQLYEQEDELLQAKENYTFFKQLIAGDDKLTARTDAILTRLDFKIETMATTYDIDLRRMSSDINTDDSEYLSQFTLDKEQIIFTRRYNGQEDLFHARQTATGYEITAIDAVNTPLNEGAHTISADGSTLVFTHCNEKFGYGGCDLYSTELQASGDWAQPANMGERINTRHWEAQPSLSADGQTLYYASTRPTGSHGASDIWVSKKRSDGIWSSPVNLGPNINTPGKEESPFIHADGLTLYFRTNGHPSLGSYDIYMASLENSTWTKPKHLGHPINTTGNDGALVVSLDGLNGYYATDTYKDVKSDNLDIFEFDLPMEFRPVPMTYIKGRITDGETKLPLIATIQIQDENNQSLPLELQSNYNGEFLVAVPVGSPSQLHVSSDGFVFYSDYVNYNEIKHGVDPHEIDIVLERARAPESTAPAAPIVLNNIFFATNSASLLPVSQNEIQYLYDLLNDNPNIQIQISGHTDNVGTDQDNLQLSQERANSVKEAILLLGIASSRITAIGMGETTPIDTNDTDEGRARNRRTEFIIIK